jgi:hypothetical protein
LPIRRQISPITFRPSPKPAKPNLDDMIKSLDEIKSEDTRKPGRITPPVRQQSDLRRVPPSSETRNNSSHSSREEIDGKSGSLDDLRARKATGNSPDLERSRRAPESERTRNTLGTERERPSRRIPAERERRTDRERRPVTEDRERRTEDRERRTVLEDRERRPVLEDRERRPVLEDRERKTVLEDRERRTVLEDRERRPVVTAARERKTVKEDTSTDSPPLRRASPASSRNFESSNEQVFDPIDEEQREFEKQKMELQKMKDAQKAADKREAEKVAKEREKRNMMDGGRRGSASAEFSLISSSTVRESLLVPEYLNALMTTLRQDDTISPVPEDFTDRAAYAAWRRDMRRSFQEVLIKMIKYRFLLPPDPAKPGFEPIQFRLRVVEARGLIQKDGRTRDTFCKIEYGDFSSQSKPKTKRVILINVYYRINMKLR